MYVTATYDTLKNVIRLVFLFVLCVSAVLTQLPGGILPSPQLPTLETANQNVLTPAQKTKLQTLRQALQLQPVICEAQAVNLLSQSANLMQGISTPLPGNVMPASRWFNTSSFLLGAPACGASFSFGGLLPALP